MDAIRSERARMGGDWAVCCVLLTRRIRDVVRWSFCSGTNVSVSQRGVGRGAACDLPRDGTRRHDREVGFFDLDFMLLNIAAEDICLFAQLVMTFTNSIN